MADTNPTPDILGSEGGKAPSVPPPSSNEEIKKLLMETNALATYVARHGDVLGDDTKGETAYKEFLTAHVTASETPSASNTKPLMEAYAKLTAITYGSRGVNGRTILDTTAQPSGWLIKRIFKPPYRPLTIGIFLFGAAMLLELLTGWAGNISDQTTQLQSLLQKIGYAVVESLSAFLIPAAWGGIGGCIFLTKRLSDKLFEMAYEESRVKGDATRIFLGAMLGVIVVVLFFPTFSDQIQVGDVSFGPATAAFIAGLGVKPVYAAFETLSEGLSEWISGKREGKGSGQ